jgi:hypothetical protein
MALGPKIKPCSAKKGIRYFVAVGCQSTTYGLALVASHPRIVSAKATAANSAGINNRALRNINRQSFPTTQRNREPCLCQAS